MEHYKNLSLESISYINDDGLICLEEWRYIVGYDKMYQISDLGRLKSFIPHNGIPIRIRKLSMTRKGYLQINLFKNTKKRNFLIHQLVGIMFIPNPLGLPEINHKKGIKTDNRAVALEWSTHDDNMAHAFSTGLINNIGTNSPISKLTDEAVLFIRASSLSYAKLAKIYNVGDSTIKSAKFGLSWAHIK